MNLNDTRHAWRLTFAYEGETFTLKSTRRLAKRVPPGQPASGGHAGRFLELRDAGRKVLYRRSIGELLSETIEYRTGDPAHPLRRARAPRHGEVSVLVPDLPGGASVAIVAAAAPASMAQAPGDPAAARAVAARDLVSVDLPGDAS
jgi:hypothetical protein